jgi:hypothetical protein
MLRKESIGLASYKHAIRWFKFVAIDSNVLVLCLLTFINIGHAPFVRN